MMEDGEHIPLSQSTDYQEKMQGGLARWIFASYPIEIHHNNKFIFT